MEERLKTRDSKKERTLQSVYQKFDENRLIGMMLQRSPILHQAGTRLGFDGSQSIH